MLVKTFNKHYSPIYHCYATYIDPTSNTEERGLIIRECKSLSGIPSVSINSLYKTIPISCISKVDISTMRWNTVKPAFTPLHSTSSSTNSPKITPTTPSLPSSDIGFMNIKSTPTYHTYKSLLIATLIITEYDPELYSIVLKGTGKLACDSDMTFNWEAIPNQESYVIKIINPDTGNRLVINYCSPLQIDLLECIYETILPLIE